MSPNEIPELLKTCKAAALAGGKELRAWRGRFKAREKGVCDFVTDADIASQQAIFRVIHERFPRHGFMGEEQSTPLDSLPTDQPVWVVDPLDGTTNYVHGYPNYAVSVAVLMGSQIVAGVIYDPVHDNCFSAATGQGAWCDDERIQVSVATSLAESMVGISLPARVDRTSPDLLDFIEVVQLCRAIRRSGSAALNLAHVANGSLDAFWASHIHPWDVAAGILLIREAGGAVTGRDGAEFNVWNPHFISAASPDLQREILGRLTPYQGVA